MNLNALLFATTVWAAASLSSHATSVLTGPAHNPATGHDYYLLSQSSWTDAEAFAQTLGGHLATINDSAEDAWVYSTFSSFGGINRTLWIGLNDAAAEGTFVWANGEPVTYVNWHAFEPNNLFNEDYTFIFPPGDGRDSLWNDSDNFGTIAGTSETVPVFGVVEVVPEPSAFALVGLGIAAWAFRRIRDGHKLDRGHVGNYNGPNAHLHYPRVVVGCRRNDIARFLSFFHRSATFPGFRFALAQPLDLTLTQHLRQRRAAKCRFDIEHKLDSLPLGLDGIFARFVGAKWRHRIDDSKSRGNSIDSCIERRRPTCA